MDNVNFLVPGHKKMSEEEVLIILEKYNLKDKSKLPKVKIKDFAVKSMKDVVVGDVVEISRTSFVGDTKYYRVVIE